MLSKLPNPLIQAASICATLLYCCTIFAQQVEPHLNVSWNNQRLDVTAKNIPLDHIVREISRKTGLVVDGEGLQTPSSAQLAGLGLGEGLKQILARVDYVFIEAIPEEAELSPGRLVILGTPARAADFGLSMNSTNVLHEPNLGARLASIQTLSDRKDSPLAVFYAATRDPDPSIREIAYRQLAVRGAPGIYAILQKDAGSPNPDVRKTAIFSAGELFGSDSVRLLMDATDDDNIDVRQTAFEELSRLENEAGIPILNDKLADPDPGIRTLAMEAIASIGENYALDAALSRLSDPDEMLRNKAEGLVRELQHRKTR